MHALHGCELTTAIFTIIALYFAQHRISRRIRVFPDRTVLEVYNLQGDVLGFSHQRSGLGMVLSVSINSAPSKGPDTTLVPWKLTRMVAGTQYPWDLTATSYTPPHWRRQIGLTASLRTFEHGSLEKCPNML